MPTNTKQMIKATKNDKDKTMKYVRVLGIDRKKFNIEKRLELLEDLVYKTNHQLLRDKVDLNAVLGSLSPKKAKNRQKIHLKEKNSTKKPKWLNTALKKLETEERTLLNGLYGDELRLKWKYSRLKTQGYKKKPEKKIKNKKNKHKKNVTKKKSNKKFDIKKRPKTANALIVQNNDNNDKKGANNNYYNNQSKAKTFRRNNSRYNCKKRSKTLDKYKKEEDYEIDPRQHHQVEFTIKVPNSLISYSNYEKNYVEKIVNSSRNYRMKEAKAFSDENEEEFYPIKTYRSHLKTSEGSCNSRYISKKKYSKIENARNKIHIREKKDKILKKKKENRPESPNSSSDINYIKLRKKARAGIKK